MSDMSCEEVSIKTRVEKMKTYRLYTQRYNESEIDILKQYCKKCIENVEESRLPFIEWIKAIIKSPVRFTMSDLDEWIDYGCRMEILTHNGKLMTLLPWDLDNHDKNGEFIPYIIRYPTTSEQEKLMRNDIVVRLIQRGFNTKCVDIYDMAQLNFTYSQVDSTILNVYYNKLFDLDQLFAIMKYSCMQQSWGVIKYLMIRLAECIDEHSDKLLSIFDMRRGKYALENYGIIINTMNFASHRLDYLYIIVEIERISPKTGRFCRDLIGQYVKS